MKKNDIGRTVVYVSRRELRAIHAVLYLTGTSFSEWVRAQMRGLIGEQGKRAEAERFTNDTKVPKRKGKT